MKMEEDGQECGEQSVEHIKRRQVREETGVDGYT